MSKKRKLTYDEMEELLKSTMTICPHCREEFLIGEDRSNREHVAQTLFYNLPKEITDSP